jgi:hypothetical protein
MTSQELPLLVNIRKSLHAALTSKFPELTALGSSMGAKNTEKVTQTDAIRRTMLSDSLKVSRLPSQCITLLLC